MRNKPMFNYYLLRRFSGVACVSTQIFFRFVHWIDYSFIQNFFQLRHVMPVCAGYDDRQRESMPVHKNMSFASIFFPCPLDWVRQFPGPVALLP